MGAYRRKIQLIAGTTYSLSLPKDWVRKNNLKEKDELIITEKNNRSLLVFPFTTEKEEIKEISLDIDKYLNDIDQILFAVYYMGAEKIKVFSNRELTKEVRLKVRKALLHMSGTEVSYEDKKQIIMKVLLDKGKVDFLQTLYRIGIIIDSSISNIINDFDIQEIRINENEVDRLYHLITKIISISLINSNVLHSSRIERVSLIPSYFLLSKRLEHFADNILYLSEYLDSKKIDFDNKNLLILMAGELQRAIKHLLGNRQEVFQRFDADALKKYQEQVSLVKNENIRSYLKDLLRHIIDIQEEVVNITFYNEMYKLY